MSPIGWALVSTSAAHAGNEVIRGFNLKSCVEERCVRVESDEARRTPLDPSYAFRRARVSVLEPGHPIRSFEVNAGYFEPDLGYVVMHGCGLINLKNGRVVLIDAGLD